MKIILFTISGAAEPVIEKLVAQGTPPSFVVPPNEDHFLRKKTIEIAHKHNIPVVMFNVHPSEEFFINRINELAPDLILVATFSHLIPESVYSAASVAAINAHPSLLPEYRGANPYYHVINNGESETGVTLHLLDNTFDTGKILKQAKVKTSPRETAGTITVKLSALMANELAEIVKIIEKSGLPKGKPQCQKAKYKAPKVLPSFANINWKDSAISIDRAVRANNPFSFLSSRINEINVIMFSGRLVDNIPLKGQTGQVIDINEMGLIVETGNGAYLITSLSYGTEWTGDAATLAKLGLINKGDCFE